jgi:hypothetical protein
MILLAPIIGGLLAVLLGFILPVILMTRGTGEGQ